MNTIVYRVIMTILLANIAFGGYAIVTYKAPPKSCVAGIIMEPKGDMMVQSGLFPTHCLPIDKD